MRIAVASDDGVSIAGHFGRCAYFIIFDGTENGAVEIERRPNSNSHHHHHEQGDCGHHDHENANHGHESFLSALHDCQVVICRGMGRRAVIDLSVKGIQPAIVAEDISAYEAAELYVRGNLNASTDSSCCSH
jgi:predicted Fe-Mo cluster-binding NifX family protein